MTIWFIQEFTNELKVIYVLGDSHKIEEFTVDSSFETKDIVEKINDDLRNPRLVKKVILKGRTLALRNLEQYYKNLGVIIQWQ